MTKLEEKLKELGYEYDGEVAVLEISYRKRFGKYFILKIIIDFKKEKVRTYQIIQLVRTIIDTTQAVNEMKKDFDILKGVENETN